MNIAFSTTSTLEKPVLSIGKSNLSLFCKKFSKKGEDKPNKGGGKKRFGKPQDLWTEELDDLFWPTCPGLDAPLDTATEVVGNLNKPAPRDPLEEEKYKNLYVPSAQEVYEQFVGRQECPPPPDDE